jgi:uncharacterized repeat protein (TIGR01451 family)
MRTLLIALLANSAVLTGGGSPSFLPLFFVPNAGQAPAETRFLAKGSGLTTFFSPDGVAFRMGETSVHMAFEGANPQPLLEGRERLPGHVNFLQGDKAQWRTGIPMYGSVVYRDLYPGIDMIYGSDGRNLKSEFVVAPGADPSGIRIRYSGGGPTRIDRDGALVIPVDGQELREQEPVAYQILGSRRIAVPARYSLAPGGSVSFIINGHDSTLPLVIDPVLVYSTYLGGSSTNAALAMAVDSSGAVYLAGYTASTNFPTGNPVQNLNGGGNDAFVAKLNPAGSALVYCTYLGGTGDDRAYGIAVDASGSAYVTGSTASKNFPVHNALQAKLAGSKNAFVVKLNASGNALVYGTYLGGSGSDTGYGIALDSAGDAYVVGDTTSATFPVSGLQTAFRGSQDAFIAKVSADGSHLVYSTFLGGSNTNHGAGIAVDSSGSAYVTGSTFSTDFPTANAFQVSNAGGQDAFIARLGVAGTSLIFSTYFGGNGGSVSYPEAGQGIALDAQGNAYVAGMTSSPNFPMIQPEQASLDGWEDAFVAKFTSAGVPVYSTYLGGSGIDIANAIAVDGAGNAYVVGYTYSMDLPVVNALQPSITGAGDVDAFVAILNGSGSALSYLSYLGGSGSNTATSVALDAAGGIYVAGWTLATSFPLLHPLQSTTGGNYNAFVLKMQQVVLRIACSHTGSFTQSQNGSYTVTVTNTATATPTNGTVTVTDTLSSGLTLVSMTGTGWTCVGATCNRSDALGAGGSYPPITVTLNVPAGATSPQQNTVTVAGGGDLASHSVVDSTNILAGVTYTISGSVTLSGVGVSGVTVALSGSQTASTTTNSAGLYTFSAVAAGGNYTVTPSGANYAFTPASQSIIGLGANQVVNFAAASNLALGKTATQSSTYSTDVAGLAVDGNTDGVLSHGSMAVANYGASPWWQVDLGASSLVSSIVVWARTDCCTSWLSDYSVFVSDTPFLATDTPTTLQSRAGTWSSHQTTAPSPWVAIAAGGAEGRYVRVQLTGTNYLELAEVQVFGTVNPAAPANLAVGMTATQSSTYSTDVAGLAVDGNTDGVLSHGSMAVANYGASPWWQVDLGASALVSSIVVWARTDCCTSWLNDYWIFVSDTPFLATDTPATLQNRSGTWSSHQTTAPNPSAAIAAGGAEGRYVRVQLTGTNYLELAEVQVFGTWNTAAPVDLAQGMTATQSATYSTDVAGLAVDGNTDGVLGDGSVSVANYGASPWWQVDLGASGLVSSIVIWARTDCCQTWLNDYWIFVSDTPFLATDTPTTLQSRAGTWSSHQTTAPGPSASIAAGGAEGRYVRVQLTGTNYLELAEVQVFGAWK